MAVFLPKYLVFILLCISSLPSHLITNQDWVDPHEMFITIPSLDKTESETIEETQLQAPSSYKSKDQPISVDTRKTKCINDVFLRRWFLALLETFHDISWNDHNVNVVEFAIHGKLRSKMRSVSQNVPLDIRTLEEILIETVHSAHIINDESSFTAVLFRLKAFFYWNREVFIPIIVLMFVLFCFIFNYPTSFFILITVACSILWNCNKVYQEKLAEKQADIANLRHPHECNRRELHWYESVYLYFGGLITGSANCQKYYKAITVDAIYEVNFLYAAVDGLMDLLSVLVKSLVKILRDCGDILFRDLSLLSAVLVSIFLSILFIFFFGYKFSLGWNFLVIEKSPINFPPIRSDVPQSVGLWGNVKKFLYKVFSRRWGNYQQVEIENKKLDSSHNACKNFKVNTSSCLFSPTPSKVFETANPHSSDNSNNIFSNLSMTYDSLFKHSPCSITRPNAENKESNINNILITDQILYGILNGLKCKRKVDPRKKKDRIKKRNVRIYNDESI